MTTAAAAEPKRIRDLRVGSQDMNKLDPRIIVIEEGHNPRDYSLAENREHLDNLKASIREHGVQQALWVRWDSGSKQAILVDGECRLRATLELIAEGVPIESVPTIQKEAGNEASRLVMAMIANTGKPLSKWEDGAGFRRLSNFGWEPEKIAKETGHKERYIREAMELANAPQAVKEMLSKGEVSPARALKATREDGDKAAEKLSGEVAEAKANGKARVKRERKAKGVTFSEEDARTIRDCFAWSLDLARKHSGPLNVASLSSAVKALALFPELPEPPAPDQSEGEELPLVVDGTKP